MSDKTPNDKSFSFHGPTRFEDLPPEMQQALDAMITAAFEQVENILLGCPKCGSENWRCYDEQSTLCYDQATDSDISVPIGFLVCDDCGHDWTDGGCGHE